MNKKKTTARLIRFALILIVLAGCAPEVDSKTNPKTIMTNTKTATLSENNEMSDHALQNERQRLQDVYGLDAPEESSSVMLGDFAFNLCGVQGVFGSSNVGFTDPDSARLSLNRFAALLSHPLPFAAECLVRN
ncbi:hypothetical protein [Saccharibacillus kuerlensis]|uniref:Lipoprotein n=1 Tax=Saccharibacillus kuerlensis TaxID=459527 RepID=A0ABQ2L5A2_9BACL|nr:hypothetical protein [Saccharibacillus kuerlensis]GGO03821.1 hypothetical protein GCM10010969_28380 [Saccharibacillus kuerlensis]